MATPALLARLGLILGIATESWDRVFVGYGSPNPLSRLCQILAESARADSVFSPLIILLKKQI